jgi:hypothetical protein
MNLRHSNPYRKVSAAHRTDLAAVKAELLGAK